VARRSRNLSRLKAASSTRGLNSPRRCTVPKSPERPEHLAAAVLLRAHHDWRVARKGREGRISLHCNSKAASCRWLWRGFYFPCGSELNSVSVVRLSPQTRGSTMHGIIYLVGLVVVIMFVLSVLGLR
jgi:hypothetical protein